MKLYYHPASTTCRPIMLLAAVERISLDYHLIDLFAGEHLAFYSHFVAPFKDSPFEGL